MTHFTQEDLVRYLYHETSEKKAAAIKAALETDWNLRETFEKLSEAQKALNQVNVAPRKKALSRILDYAARKQAEKEGEVHSH